MIEQDAKKELYSYLHSKKLEERKLEQIEEQKAKLTKITSILSDMPKGTDDFNITNFDHVNKILTYDGKDVKIEMQRKGRNAL